MYCFISSTILTAALLISKITAQDDSAVITKDIVIIGGGASGAHAAVRLREDLDQDIILIEKQSILGGHVDSYTDPATGVHYDYGVQSFNDYGKARKFFARLGVETAIPRRFSRETQYVDFSAAQPLVNFTGPTAAAQKAALEKYVALCELYEYMILPGYDQFPEGGDIPEDLLMKFSDFAIKHDILDALPIMFTTTAIGMGNFTDALTLYVMQSFGGQMGRVLLGRESAMVPATFRNQDLYDAAATLLGDDVLYNTVVDTTMRTDEGVTVTVVNTEGKKTTFKAKKLLVAIVPVLDNLHGFDLDDQETGVFSRWQYNRLYAGVVQNPSLPINGTLYNLPLAAAPSNYLTYPAVSFTGRFDAYGPDVPLFRVMVTGDEQLTPRSAVSMVQSDFSNMVEAGIMPTSEKEELEFLALANHGPMGVWVTAEELRDGFVQKQYALQGRRSTWFTGGAFAGHFQTILWEYNEFLLPKIMESM
ncbi:hypothetical protein Daus18300_011338 [Diaporthe australafricana]|uniref:Amine oxidase n=1 Tax=Diaporthe australafricana TaxID=127596 RepID=A0ABR3W6V2_9PEZI